MSVSFSQKILHSTFKPYFNSDSYSHEYKKLPNIDICACYNITEKATLLKSVAHKFDFVYVFTNFFESVKKLYINQYAVPEVSGSITGSEKHLIFSFVVKFFLFVEKT